MEPMYIEIEATYHRVHEEAVDFRCQGFIRDPGIQVLLGLMRKRRRRKLCTNRDIQSYQGYEKKK